MALTINTNLSSMIVQSNLTKSTNMLNSAIERMTTGYKINCAADNAAGFSIARNWETQLSSLDVAADNAAMGSDLLTTLEDNYSLIVGHLQRVRDLTEQAANGTYGSESKDAIEAEVKARLEEIDRISANCEYNGIKLMNNGGAIDLRVGIKSDDNSKINLANTLFTKCNIKSIFADESGAADDAAARNSLAQKCSGKHASVTAATTLGKIDTVIKNISSKVTSIGAAQNRIDSAIEAIGVQTENVTSSLSTLKDADVAEESSRYIKAQILQQASATLLATANQSPSIALNLI